MFYIAESTEKNPHLDPVWKKCDARSLNGAKQSVLKMSRFRDSTLLISVISSYMGVKIHDLILTREVTSDGNVYWLDHS